MSNVNFQAKLDLKKVKGSKARWQNIAKMFEEKTKNHPTDKFILEGSFNSGLYASVQEDGQLLFDEANILYKATERLKKLSDNNLVKNIIEVFNFIKNEEARNNQIEKFADSFKLNELSKIDGGWAEQEYYDVMCKITSLEKEKFKKDHPVFGEDIGL